MIRLRVETKELFRFVNRLDQMGTRNKTVIHNALNEVGQALRHEIADDIARDSGLAASEVEKILTVVPASEGRNRFEIMVKNFDMNEEETGRGLPRRTFQSRRSGEFQQGQLVKVVTREDGKVCPICEAIAEGGPYTIEEARSNVHHGATIGLNNCRCLVIPFLRRRRLPVEFSGATGDAGRMTLGQIAERVRDKVKINLSIR